MRKQSRWNVFKKNKDPGSTAEKISMILSLNQLTEKAGFSEDKEDLYEQVRQQVRRRTRLKWTKKNFFISAFQLYQILKKFGFLVTSEDLKLFLMIIGRRE